MVNSANRPPPSNQLLASLPAADFDRLASTLDIIPLKLKDILHKSGDYGAACVFSRRGVSVGAHRAGRWRQGGSRHSRTRRRRGIARSLGRWRPVAVRNNRPSRDGYLLSNVQDGLSARDGSARSLLRADHKIPVRFLRRCRSINRVQCGPFGRAAARALVADGPRPRWTKQLSADPGIRGDDARGDTANGHRRGRDTPEGRVDHIPPWPRHYRRIARNWNRRRVSAIAFQPNYCGESRASSSVQPRCGEHR